MFIAVNELQRSGDERVVGSIDDIDLCVVAVGTPTEEGSSASGMEWSSYLDRYAEFAILFLTPISGF